MVRKEKMKAQPSLVSIMFITGEILSQYISLKVSRMSLRILFLERLRGYQLLDHLSHR